MNSEKVKEIKKASEYCSQGKCEKCSIGKKDIKKCVDILLKDTLTYINELESENERLRKDNKLLRNAKVVYENVDYCYEDLKKAEKRIAELEKENGELKQHITEVEKGIINIAKERNKKDELASKFIDSYNDSLKQFAERLKEYIEHHHGNYGDLSYSECEYIIDETLKEFINKGE